MINNKVTLFDVSFWQDNDYTPYKINFQAMRFNGGDGVILRAGQNVWVDEDYLDYARAADEAGLPRGAYWFYDSRVDPITQANLFADAVNRSGFPKLGIWADFEERYGGPYRSESHFKQFTDRLKTLFPNKLIGIYTAYYYWMERTTSVTRMYFSQFPLWVAHYRTAIPLVPPPWNVTGYKIWQYTDQGDGELFGAESKEIDMNVFAGTLEDYKRFFSLDGYVPSEPPPVEGEEGMFRVWSETNNMSLRTQASISGNYVETVPRGMIMKADIVQPPVSGGIPGDLWAHIIEVNGVTKNAWVAIRHLGDVYCKYEPIPETGEKHVLEVYLDGNLEFRKEF